MGKKLIELSTPEALFVKVLQRSKLLTDSCSIVFMNISKCKMVVRCSSGQAGHRITYRKEARLEGNFTLINCIVNL